VTGYTFNWGVVGQYRGAFIEALLLSVQLAGIGIAAGLLGGLLLALMSQSAARPARAFALGYISVARNTPLLLLVFVVYLVLPQYGLHGLDATATFAVALSFVAAGAMAENFRAAFATMPKAYLDGARALGLAWHDRLVFVVLPIAIRYALPALTNSAVAVFKDTSLASIIAVHDLTYVARELSTNLFRVVEAWVVVAGLYLIVSSVLALAARALERRLPRLG
jgi:His/Glu/Gln/Arg/opine family amino acid ABC transporter permease subunit